MAEKRKMKNDNIERNHDKINYIWTITDYIGSLPSLKRQVSPVFPEKNASSQWRLDIFAADDDYDYDDDYEVSGYDDCDYYNDIKFELYLLSEVSDFEVVTEFYIYILNPKTKQRISNKSYSCTFKKKLTSFTEKLFHSSEWSNYDFFNKLTIEIEIIANYPKSFAHKTTPTTNTLFNLSLNLQCLLKNHDFSDFVIKVSGTEIKVHKAILASRSAVFSSMLNNDFKESKKGCLEITDLDQTTVMSLINFIYGGQICLTTEDEAKNLLIASNKYEILDLKEICENYLIQKLSVASVLDVLVLADRHNAVQLKNKAIDYVAKNIPKFSDKKLYQNMLETENVSSLLVDILTKISTINSNK